MVSNRNVNSFSFTGDPINSHTWFFGDDDNSSRKMTGQLILDCSYFNFEGMQLAQIGGITINEDGDSKSLNPAIAYYDANRNPNGNRGVDSGHQGQGDNYQPTLIFMDTSYDGAILRKRHAASFFILPVFMQEQTTEYAFIDPTGRYFATYLQIEDPRAIEQRVEINFGVQNSVSPFGGIAGLLASTGRDFVLADPVQALVEYPRPYTFSDYMEMYGSGDDDDRDLGKEYKNYLPAPMSSG